MCAPKSGGTVSIESEAKIVYDAGRDQMSALAVTSCGRGVSVPVPNTGSEAGEKEGASLYRITHEQLIVRTQLMVHTDGELVTV